MNCTWSCIKNMFLVFELHGSFCLIKYNHLKMKWLNAKYITSKKLCLITKLSVELKIQNYKKNGEKALAKKTLFLFYSD